MANATKRLLAILCMGMMTLTASAQSEESQYFTVVDYMKVAPDMIEAYIDMEQDLWSKIHQARLCQN